MIKICCSFAPSIFRSSLPHLTLYEKGLSTFQIINRKHQKHLYVGLFHLIVSITTLCIVLGANNLYNHNAFPNSFSSFYVWYIPEPLSDDQECKIIENIDLKYFSNRASFLGNPVDR